MRGGSWRSFYPFGSADRQIRSGEGEEKNHASKENVDDGKCHDVGNGGISGLEELSPIAGDPDVCGHQLQDKHDEGSGKADTGKNGGETFVAFAFVIIIV